MSCGTCCHPLQSARVVGSTLAGVPGGGEAIRLLQHPVMGAEAVGAAGALLQARDAAGSRSAAMQAMRIVLTKRERMASPLFALQAIDWLNHASQTRYTSGP